MDFQASLQPLFEKLNSWLDGAIALLPNLTVAVIAFGVRVGGHPFTSSSTSTSPRSGPVTR